MRFTLVDRIVELEPGSRVVAIKNLTMAEEYLAEHFPSFPVMPGVMMVEAITQTGAWAVRVGEGLRHSVILLREAKTVKFGHLVMPGRQLRVSCEVVDDDGRNTVIKAKGTLEGQACVSAKVVLTRFNLADRDPTARRDDQRLRAHQLRSFRMLATPELRQRYLAPLTAALSEAGRAAGAPLSAVDG
ncbi:MAG: 3-hydroxyacyl-ACP dehydratase FabZ family protein [Planctomycetia bacterium]